VALDGNPFKYPDSLSEVKAVMKEGMVYTPEGLAGS
jgi:imidazolonepropionase-like amidohydrolase